jgi:hypothetical protein
MIITFMTGGGTQDDSERPCGDSALSDKACMDGYKKLDVMVRPGQRIADVCAKLIENGFLPPLCEETLRSVYSLRRKEYVNPLLTFWQGRVYAGDILIIGEVISA